MTFIGVVNKSTCVRDEDVFRMTQACALQVRLHAAPWWWLLPVPVMTLPDENHAPPGSWVIAVLDDPDQAGSLGWHTEDTGDDVYGRVFAKPVLDNGGDALTKSLSVASVLSHEVLETLVDRYCNRWADAGNGTSYALEVCDPVESDSYTIPVRGALNSIVQVSVSNFCTPHWFDPNAAPSERLDYLGRCTAPFTMTPGGYTVQMSNGQVTQQFGEKYPDWRKATKQADTARAARRMS